jgi:hypothetical protein
MKESTKREILLMALIGSVLKPEGVVEFRSAANNLLQMLKQEPDFLNATAFAVASVERMASERGIDLSDIAAANPR